MFGLAVISYFNQLIEIINQLHIQKNRNIEMPNILKGILNWQYLVVATFIMVSKLEHPT